MSKAIIKYKKMNHTESHSSIFMLTALDFSIILSKVLS